MITAGIWSVLPFIQYFFRDVGRIPHADTFTSEWELVVLAAATPLGLVGGWLSDRLGRKKFVYAAGGLQGLVLAVFVITYTHEIAWVFALGALYGIGYGLYYAVDWAIACDTLPDKSQTAKDMGLFHVAYTLPQVLFPSVLGFVLGAVNGSNGTGGYRVVFSFGIVFYLLGTILVSRIKSVR
jgi:MFS family permease